MGEALHVVEGLLADDCRLLEAPLRCVLPSVTQLDERGVASRHVGAANEAAIGPHPIEALRRLEIQRSSSLLLGTTVRGIEKLVEGNGPCGERKRLWAVMGDERLQRSSCRSHYPPLPGPMPRFEDNLHMRPVHWDRFWKD